MGFLRIINPHVGYLLAESLAYRPVKVVMRQIMVFKMLMVLWDVGNWVPSIMQTQRILGDLKRL